MSFNLTSLVPLWVKILLAAVLSVGTFGVGMRAGYIYRDDTAQKAVVAQANKDKQQAQDLQSQLTEALKQKRIASGQLQDALDKLKVESDAAIKKSHQEVVSNPVYQQCVVPDNGLRQLNDEAQRLNQLRAGHTTN